MDDARLKEIEYHMTTLAVNGRAYRYLADLMAEVRHLQEDTLRSAAPDLLEACEAALKHMHDRAQWDKDRATYNALERAIAKARGES